LEIDKHGKYISVSNEGGLSSKFIRHSDSENTNNDIIMMNGNHPNSNNNDTKKNDDNDDDNKNNDKQKKINNILENGVKLESFRCGGLFFSVHPNDGVYINKDIDNEHNLLYFLVRGKTDEGLFKKPYLLKQQNTIIINHAFGGSIRVNPKNENIVDSKGDKDMLSRWEALPNDNSTTLQFRNVKSGAFLRILDSQVSCCDGKSDPNTIFKVHVVQSPNIVKLESASFENQFISVRQKGLCIGNGGPHCQMTLYRKD